MAKRDKKDDGDEEYEFQVPDFDEDAFIHKELVSFRTTMVLFGWGVVAALISWGLFVAMDGARTAWFVGLFVAAAAGYALRFVYKVLKLDISHFGRKEWLGTGFLFFFTWLAFFIILVNPPFTDFAEPRADVYIVPGLQQAGGDVLIHASFEDNHRVVASSFVLTRGAETIATLDDFVDQGRGHHRLHLTAPQTGEYRYTAVAEDAKGHITTTNGTFQVRSNAMVLDPTALADGQLTATETILVSFLEPMELRRVYLDMIDSDRQVDLLFDERFGGWSATAQHAGWVQGNNTFRVVAETFTQWNGIVEIPPGQLVLEGPYHVDVTASVGQLEVPVPRDHLIPDNVRQVPGPSALLVVAGLLVVAAVVRRNRD